MTAVQVKICGITCLEDGLAALRAGADLLGFNFYPPSPRFLLADPCARLVSELRASGYDFQAVGVFVNHPPQEIESLLERCGLDLAQLSGDEPPACLAALGSRAFKALRPKHTEALLADLERYPTRTGMPAYLVDAYRPGAYGGTGQVIDWDLASDLAGRHSILLAGGLTPENVAVAIRQVHPWGVDVASGVENAPGRKDPTKLAAFLLACRQAAGEPPSGSILYQEHAHAKPSID